MFRIGPVLSPGKVPNVLRVILVAFLMSVMAFAAAGVAEEPVPNVAAELVKIHAALEKIATLLARQSDSADVDLLMKRVQLGQSRISEYERQLKDAEKRREELQDRKTQLEMQVQMTRTRNDNASEPRMSPEELDSWTQRFDEQLKRTNQRLSEASAEIAEIQGHLMESVEGVRDWQVVLDRRLAGR